MLAFSDAAFALLNAPPGRLLFHSNHDKRRATHYIRITHPLLRYFAALRISFFWCFAALHMSFCRESIRMQPSATGVPPTHCYANAVECYPRHSLIVHASKTPLTSRGFHRAMEDPSWSVVHYRAPNHSVLHYALFTPFEVHPGCPSLIESDWAYGPAVHRPGLRSIHRPGLRSTGPGLQAIGRGLRSIGPGLWPIGPGLRPVGPGLRSIGPGLKFSAGPDPVRTRAGHFFHGHLDQGLHLHAHGAGTRMHLICSRYHAGKSPQKFQHWKFAVIGLRNCTGHSQKY